MTTRDRTPYQATFAVLAVGVGAFALLQSLVIPVLPTIQAGLHTSQNTVTWVLTVYLLSASIFTPIMGRLGDMFGKQGLLVVALAALTAGSVLSAVSTSVAPMLVGRVIQGVGGGVIPLSFGLIRDEFPREKVAGAVGMIAALGAAGAGLGIVLAGPIVKALDYHWLFWLPAIMLAIAAVAAHFVVPESLVRSPGRVNWSAMLLLSGWLVALILAVSEAPTWGWGSLRVLGLLVMAAILGAVWVLIEVRSSHPLIDMRMMRIQAVWTTNLVALLLGFGMYAMFAFLPEFLQTPRSAGYGFGVSITTSGLILLPSSVFMFIFGLISGRASRRFSAKAVLVAGLGVSIVPFVLLTLAHGTEGVIVAAMAIQGLGFGLAYASMSSLVIQAVPAAQTGVATGMNANIRTIGGSIGAAVMSSIVTSSAHHGRLPKESGYTHGFALLAVATVAAAVAGLIIPKGRRDRPAVEAIAHGELGLVAAGTLVDERP